MEDNKVISKGLKVRLRRFPVNALNQENCSETKANSQNPPEKSLTKKNVSFCEQSSILYFNEDESTDTLQNSSSLIFDHSDEIGTVDKISNSTPRISHSEIDVTVVIEKLPKILIEKFVKGNVSYYEDLSALNDGGIKHCNSNAPQEEMLNKNIYDSDSISMQEIESNTCPSKDLCDMSPSVATEIDYPLKELKVVIHRLPDNLLQIHWNHINTQISPEKNMSQILSVAPCSGNSENETYALKYCKSHNTVPSRKKGANSMEVKKQKSSNRNPVIKSCVKKMCKAKKMKQQNLSDKPANCSLQQLDALSLTKTSEYMKQQNLSDKLTNYSLLELDDLPLTAEDFNFPNSMEARKEKSSNRNSKTKSCVKKRCKTKQQNLSHELVNFSLDALSLTKTSEYKKKESKTAIKQKVDLGNCNSENPGGGVAEHQKLQTKELVSNYENKSKLVTTSSQNPCTQVKRSDLMSYPCNFGEVGSSTKEAANDPFVLNVETQPKFLSDSSTEVKDSGNSILLKMLQDDKINSLREPTAIAAQDQYIQKLSGLCKKRLCIHLEKLDLRIPEASTAMLKKTKEKKSQLHKKSHKQKGNFPGSTCFKNLPSCTNSNIKSHKSSIKKDHTRSKSKKSDLSLPYISKVYSSVVPLSSNSSKSLESSVMDDISGDEDLPLSYVSKISSDGPSTSANSSKSAESSVMSDSSSDDVPLQWFTKNNLKKRKSSQANLSETFKKKSGKFKTYEEFNAEDRFLLSCFNTFNYVDTSNLSTNLTKKAPKEIPSLISDNSSEENYPLSHLTVSNFHAKTSQLTNLSKKKSKNTCVEFSLSRTKVSMDHCYSKSLSVQNSNDNASTGSPLTKIRLDHCYHIPFRSDISCVKSSTSRIQEKRLDVFNCNRDLQSLIARTKEQVEKLNKQDGLVLTDNTEMKKTSSKALLNNAVQNEDLPSKLKGSLNFKSRSIEVNTKKFSRKKKKFNKKTLMKKQAEVYDMMIKYLRKHTKAKSKKKSHKTVKSKNNSAQQCENEQQQPVSIKVEPRSESDTDTADETCAGNGNFSSGSGPVTANDITVAPEPSYHVDIPQSSTNCQRNKTQEKTIDKYRLGFLSRNKSLRFYNTCLASERLLLCNRKLKKKQRKKLKKMFKQLKKVYHVENDKI